MNWRIIWWNGVSLVETHVFSDIWNIASNAASSGVNMGGILKVERLPITN